jgi:mRNA interferase YafQ
MRIHASSRLKKDVQRCQKRGYPLDRLEAVIDGLEAGQPLDPRWKNHHLLGVYEGAQECHLLLDWLLIYDVDDDRIYLVRTGTHADLFEMIKTAFAVFAYRPGYTPAFKLKDKGYLLGLCG